MQRIILMLALVVAGELIFGIPFNVPRFFRPTMLEVFGISNTQLGDMFAIYGITAMLAYFPGGTLADHFSARSLIAASLFATAIGGFYMATIPGETAMSFLYGYWGLTTIFLFWGALIRATREWGGEHSQGVAFGILDGGRGLVAASIAAIGVTILSIYLPDNARLATPEEREAGFKSVIWLYCILTIAAGIFAWFAIPVSKKGTDVEFNPLKGMATVLRRPIIWAQAAIIVCAYCGYKGLDNYSLYAVQVLGLDEVEGATGFLWRVDPATGGNMCRAHRRPIQCYPLYYEHVRCADCLVRCLVDVGARRVGSCLDLRQFLYDLHLRVCIARHLLRIAGGK